MIDIKKEIRVFKREFDPLLLQSLEKEIEHAAHVSEELGWMLNTMKSFALSRGKRVRPFLFFESMKGLLGEDENISEDDIMNLSVFIELIHLQLLVLDDIMDKSPSRHGVETVHVQEKKKFAFEFGDEDAEHFGISAGIISGVIFGNVAMTHAASFLSQFNHERLLRVIRYYNNVVIQTAYGQFHDMHSASKETVSEDMVHTIHVYKTAKYTIEGPLVAGAIMADREDGVPIISHFAEPLGIAFQIVDDIIGTFGTDEHIGKSVKSDLEEGKHTFLTVHAHDVLEEAEKNELRDLLAKKKVTDADFNRFKELIVVSGSRKYSEDLAQKYLQESLQKLAFSAYNESAKERLTALAQFIVQRDY